MINIVDITKRFGDNNVLCGINCSFEKDKVTSIMAPNGSGKTTLLSIISGFLIPNKGSINFSEKCNPINTSVIFSGEKNLYMKNTVQENILYFGIIQGMKKDEILKKVRIYEQYFPFINKVKNKLAESLSYGQKRLLAIFSAIVTNAKCIIIDEVSEGLDMEYVSLVSSMLHRAAEDRVIILASHDCDFVSEVSDKILFLGNGKILKECDKLNLEELKKLYKTIYNLNSED